MSSSLTPSRFRDIVCGRYGFLVIGAMIIVTNALLFIILSLWVISNQPFIGWFVF